MTKIKRTFPYKGCVYQGVTQCTPEMPWGTHYVPTDGSGVQHFKYCDGTPVTYPAPGSNQLAYFKGANPSGTPYALDIGMDAVSFIMYERDIATFGVGNTRLDDWAHTYVDMCDQNNLKWTLNMMEVMYGGGVNIYDSGSSGSFTHYGSLNYQTPGYDSSYYTPASGFTRSYESLLGPALDHIEADYSTNFMGYNNEGIFTNALIWLYNRTNYWIQVKDWTGWVSSDSPAGIFNQGTDSNGRLYTQTIAERFNYVDEITIEPYVPEFFKFMIPWQEKAEALGKPVSFNIDHPCRSIDANGKDVSNKTDNWWVAQGVGQPNNRCWWERLGMLQITNYFRERFGPYDGWIFNPVTQLGAASGNKHPDYPYFLNWLERLYLSDKVQEVSI